MQTLEVRTQIHAPIETRLYKFEFVDRFEEFELEAGVNQGCQYDYVAVYDGDVISNSSLIGKYCGSALPSQIRTVSNKMTVVFKTDASVTKGGFRALYTETYGPAQGVVDKSTLQLVLSV
ncbi:CUBN [Bugula neritina]|uniref:CUBN n=1 Tax=Bugula neritina TaxID=10212 RepID=A0A7J7IY64_BUGNE|nr:CUBN [Bugula neritina]